MQAGRRAPTFFHKLISGELRIPEAEKLSEEALVWNSPKHHPKPGIQFQYRRIRRRVGIGEDTYLIMI